MFARQALHLITRVAIVATRLCPGLMPPLFKRRFMEWLVLLNRNPFSSRQTLAYGLILAGLLIVGGAETVAAQWQRYPDAEIGKTAETTVEWQKDRDEDTGYEVWQMSSSDAGTWAAHFESQGFSAEDRFVIFSSHRTGDWQLYRADLSTGEVLQLTDLESVEASNFTVHPNGVDVYFSFDGRLGRVDLLTGQIHGLTYEVPVRFRIVISNDGRHTVLSSYDGEQTTLHLVSLPDGEILAQLRWPPGRMLDSGLRWNGRLSHPMINPGYPYLVSFVPSPDQQNDMSRPQALRARTWIWDARTGEVRPFLTVPPHFRATHETWSRSGDRFFFFQKTQPGWVPNHIASMDKSGDDWQIHHTDATLRLGHGAPSHDDQWFISDGQDPGRNPLRLIHLETGNWETLCWPDAAISPGHAAQSHVHPSFSASGDFVTYTSDRTGSPEVYVVPIPPEVKQKLKTGLDVD